ncbi:MAG: hypothetical protein Q7S25_04635, partial [Candidatus Limnocylindria bacterium]|nr:hypothetical protein [Candidatus Limnocylindria bacterium]
RRSAQRKRSAVAGVVRTGDGCSGAVGAGDGSEACAAAVGADVIAGAGAACGTHADRRMSASGAIARRRQAGKCTL